MADINVKPVDQKYYKLFDMINEKVGKDELMYTGFTSTYGHLQIRPPIMAYAHGDFRTINVGWTPPVGYSNTSHYLLQVSDNNIDWYGLGFTGEWYTTLGETTTVFGNNIAHTRIPFDGDATRQLYYRAATVSKDGEISVWSETIQGNTFFIEACDLQPGAYFNEFSYTGRGIIEVSGAAESGTTIYTGSGNVTLSGAAATEVSSVISFGSEYASSSAIGYTPFHSIIDTNKFIVNYTDSTNSSYGTSVVGTISGSTISYGSTYAFNSSSSDSFNSVALDSTHFVVFYRDSGDSYLSKCVVGTVSGSTISYGSAYTVHSAHSSSTAGSIEAIDSTHFVVAYSDSNNSNYGTMKIGTVSGSTISYGSAYVFNSATTTGETLTLIDSTHIIITYNDTTASEGQSIIGTISGSTLSFGSEYVFNTVSSYAITTDLIDSTHFVIAYRNGATPSIGVAIIGTISGSTISYGSKYTFNNDTTGSIFISVLDSTNFVISYEDNSDGGAGKAKQGTISGSTISYGDESLFHDGNIGVPTSFKVDSTHVGIGYNDQDDSSIVKAIIGTIS